MLAARDLRAAEARADFEALGGGNREHGVGEFGLELVKHGLAESCRDAPDDTGDGATDGVQCLFGADNTLPRTISMGIKGS